MNKVFTQPTYQNKQGYQGFPMDHFLNFTSVCGYLLPVVCDLLDPGDKVKIDNLIRTRTQPFTKPAMATMIERMEWFAVPIDQLYKPFSSKFYGINDLGSDFFKGRSQTDYLPYFTKTYLHERLKNLPTLPPEQSGIPVSMPSFAMAKRLMDCFGYTSKLGDPSIPDGDAFAGSVSALIPAAYQKIWFDHYRLTDWDSNDPECYNLDTFYGTENVGNADPNRFNKLYMLRRRPYQLDYFTSMIPSPLVGKDSVSMIGTDLTKVNQWLTGLSDLMTGSPSNISNQNSQSGTTSSNTIDPSSVGFKRVVAAESVASIRTGLADLSATINAPNIRSMFAVEKLLEVTRRAKKHYDMQTLAHFGVEVPKGLAGECFKLGTFENYIQIGDVISTADTAGSDGASLGALAGKGESNNSRSRREPIHFEAKCHCILMGIYSCEPIMNYCNYGTMALHQMTNASQFFKMEFDNLGEQPLFLQELNDFNFTPGQGASGTALTSVLGWIKRYQQLKAKYNRSFGGCGTPFFEEWALNRKIIGDSGISKNFFYVWPTDINNILQDQYDDEYTYETMFSDDYFVTNVYLDYVKTSKKSVFGVPNL